MQICDIPVRFIRDIAEQKHKKTGSFLSAEGAGLFIVTAVLPMDI